MVSNVNGQPWRDADGRLIQAHGGTILANQHTYYWYGEDRSQPAFVAAGRRVVPFTGVRCYSSTNLRNWHDAGRVLTAASDPEGRLQVSSVVERPKVLFNTETRKFVMWAHFDDQDYNYAGCVVATADAPTGPFTVHDVLRPNRQESRDMTLVQDGGQAYLCFSSDMNQTLYFAQLTPDYLGLTGFSAKILVDQAREAPTVFHDGEWYFTITSGTTGWRPNAALYSRSRFLFSGQKLIDNPCVGPAAATTYGGQPAAVFAVAGRWYLLLDHWQPADLSQSGYSILPIEITGRDLHVAWTQTPFGGEVKA